MSDALLIAVAVLLIALVPFDLRVLRRFVRSARRRPRIEFLSRLTLGLSFAAAAATMAALLGVHTVVLFVSQRTVRLIDPALALVMLIAIAVFASVPLVIFQPLFARWDREAEQLHIHHRDAERRVVRHRRADDPKP